MFHRLLSTFESGQHWEVRPLWDQFETYDLWGARGDPSTGGCGKDVAPLFQIQHVLTPDSNPAIIHLPSLLIRLHKGAFKAALQIGYELWKGWHVNDDMGQAQQETSNLLYTHIWQLCYDDLKKSTVLAFRDIKRADGPMINSHHRWAQLKSTLNYPRKAVRTKIV